MQAARRRRHPRQPARRDDRQRALPARPDRRPAKSFRRRDHQGAADPADWYLGLANMRGNLISVIDLAAASRAPSHRDRQDSRIVAFAPAPRLQLRLLVIARAAACAHRRHDVKDFRRPLPMQRHGWRRCDWRHWYGTRTSFLHVAGSRFIARRFMNRQDSRAGTVIGIKMTLNGVQSRLPQGRLKKTPCWRRRTPIRPGLRHGRAVSRAGCRRAAEPAMLRPGTSMRRRASAAADELEERQPRLPLIGHLSLPRQLRILLGLLRPASC